MPLFKILNFALFQAGWFAAALMLDSAVWLMLGMVVMHFVISPTKLMDARLLIILLPIGLTLEVLMISLGLYFVSGEVIELETQARSSEPSPWYLFSHCTEKTKLPNAEKEWGAIFTHFGGVLNTVPVGCCGMAGTFGHEVDKLQMSKDIYGLSWKPSLADLPKERCLVTGYSCRSQVKRFEGVKLAHPLQALLQLVD